MENSIMDTPDEKTPADLSPAFPDGDWRSELESVRQLIQSVLILTIVVSGTLNIFLYREFKSAKTDAKVWSEQMRALEYNYLNSDGPTVEKFWQKLIEYGRANPEFLPVLNKYGVGVPGPAPSQAAPTSASPAPVPAPTNQGKK
jgi:hypothetical protein